MLEPEESPLHTLNKNIRTINFLYKYFKAGVVHPLHHGEPGDGLH